MRYKELGIETRREAPARARTEGEALLVRAGYLSGDGELTTLGGVAVARLQSQVTGLASLLAKTGLVNIRYASDKLAFPSPDGETEILRCPACGYADEAELAVSLKSALPPEEALPTRRVATPDCDSIEALANFLGIGKERTGKAMMYARRSDGRLVFVMVRGDMQVSAGKLERIAGQVEPATSKQVVEAGAVPGYASPIGLHGALVIVDDLVPKSTNLAVGANEPGYHLLNVNFGRDFGADIVEDVALAGAGDPCPSCATPLVSLRVSVLADGGRMHALNVLKACAESFRDEKGLRLPPGVAPFDVHLVLLRSKRTDTRAAAEALYHELQVVGVEVLYDDREASPGVKFNDADLIGCPLRLTVGERTLQEGMIEWKRRDADAAHLVQVDEARDTVRALLRESDA